MANLYTYVNAIGDLATIDESQIVFVGAWRTNSFYYRDYSVTHHSGIKYICLTPNSDKEPPVAQQSNAFWSILAFTSTGTSFSGTDAGGGATTAEVQAAQSQANAAYSVARTALDTAWVGTNTPAPGSIDPWIMGWIDQTYHMAIAGTSTANAAYKMARTALDTAWVGTGAASAAYKVARPALDTSWVGTAAAAAAQSQANAAYSVARTALDTAWVGTDTPTASLDPSTMAWLSQTYNLAVTGTAAASAAYAVARPALDTAWAGTNSGAAAYKVARTALDTSWTGTAAASAAYVVARPALDTAWVGTAAAAAAYSLARTALDTAWVGTDTPVSSPGGSGLDTYWAGTDYSKSLFQRLNGTITTGSLAPSYYETGYSNLGKSISIIKTTSGTNFPFRVRLYSTAAGRDSDISRGATVIPSTGSQHQVIFDLALNSTTGFTWVSSPKAIGSNADNPPVDKIYYTVNNLDTAGHPIDVIFSYQNLEPN